MAGIVAQPTLSQAQSIPHDHVKVLKGPVFSLAMHGTTLFAGHHNGIIDVFSSEFEKQSQVVELAAHTGIVRKLVVHRDLLFSCSVDGTAKCWTLPDCQ